VKQPFKARRHGVQVRLPEPERALLVQLLGQLDELLDDGAPERSADPLAELVGMDLGGPPERSEPFDDPALARLLPDGSREDPEVAAEFRRLTERGLRGRKRDGARLAASALGRPEPVLLDADEAQALLKSLTDVRLVLAERLGLRTDEDATLLHERLIAAAGPDEPWAAAAAIYDVLTWWQESLVGALPRSRR
jgi:hypothetical protein